jgi:nitrogen regulatory protein PII
MKKIIAIIRNECVRRSLSSLENLGITGVTELQIGGESAGGCNTFHPNPEILPGPSISQYALQRGQGITYSGTNGHTHPATAILVPEFTPRTMLIIGAIEEQVLPTVQALIRVNHAESDSECEIYVCPVVTAIGIEAGDDDD